MNLSLQARLNRRHRILFLLFAVLLAVLNCLVLQALLLKLTDYLETAPLTDDAEQSLTLLSSFLDALIGYLKAACALIAVGIVLTRRFYLPDAPGNRRFILAAGGAFCIPYLSSYLFSGITGQLADDALYITLNVALNLLIDLLALLLALLVAARMRKRLSPAEAGAPRVLHKAFGRAALFAALLWLGTHLLLCVLSVVLEVLNYGAPTNAAEVWYLCQPFLTLIVQSGIGYLLFRLLAYDTVRASHAAQADSPRQPVRR